MQNIQIKSEEEIRALFCSDKITNLSITIEQKSNEEYSQYVNITLNDFLAGYRIENLVRDGFRVIGINALKKNSMSLILANDLRQMEPIIQ